MELKDIEEKKKGGKLKRKLGQAADNFEDSENFVGVRKKIKGGGGKIGGKKQRRGR